MAWRRFIGGSWPPMIGAFLGTVLILSYHDITSLELAKFGLYLALAVALPGVFCWRLLLARSHTGDGSPPTWFEDLTLGTIFGFGIQLPIYLIGVWVNVPLLFLILPLVAIIVSLATPLGRRVWTMPTETVDVRIAWTLAFVVMYALAWLGHYLFPLRSLTLPLYETPSVDETFHQALISELLHRFPPQIPFLLGTRLDYHWFVHAQMAADHWATHLGTQALLRELMPAAMMTLTILGLGAVALRLSGRPVAGVIAPALLIMGAFSLMGPSYHAGQFTEPFMSWRFIASPSQSYGFMMALPAILLILEVLRPDRRPTPRIWITLAMALFALSGSKATFMPIFLCGAIAVWFVHLVFKRTVDWTVAALAGLLLVVTIFAQVVLFGGSSGAMTFDPFETVAKALNSQGIEPSTGSAAAMTATLLVGWLLYGVGAVGLVRNDLWRDPRALWMLACIPTGIGVAFVFFRAGLSQLWFQRSVAELVVIVSAWGVVQLLPDPLPRRQALALGGVAASGGLAAFLIGNYFESGKKLVEFATYRELVATALAPFCVIAIYLVVRLVTSRTAGGRRPGPAVLLALLLGLGSTSVYTYAVDTVTRDAPPKDPDKAMFARGGVAAARWIEDNSQRYDVVATNVHCRLPNGKRCDNRNFWVSAYSERRIVVEGWGYTSTTNGEYSEGARNAYIAIPDKERLKINDAAFTNPSVATIGRLVETYDVKYLFVSKLYAADIPGLQALTGLVKETFDNENYVVFKVLAP